MEILAVGPVRPGMTSVPRDGSMRLKESYTFLYIPDDQAPCRRIRIARWVVLCAVAGTGTLLVLAAMAGWGWRSGGDPAAGDSPLAQENRALVATVATLEGKVAQLRREIAGVFAVQNLMAQALDLPPLDEETFAAGVGGRGSGLVGTADTLGYHPAPAGDPPRTDLDLDQLLRQAQIQRQGYLAMLDTLSARQTLRAHLPSIRPLDFGFISSRFGYRTDPFTGRQTFHHGLDFLVPMGTQVLATGDGIVSVVQQQRGFGRVVKIDHGNGLVTVYAHLNAVLVTEGAVVRRGDLIAKSGNSGRVSAPHLHYEVHLHGRPVNPAIYILDTDLLPS
jgi:murein DD-endopeptidase MepM/ murein hydrolase activator NlpD